MTAPTFEQMLAPGHAVMDALRTQLAHFETEHFKFTQRQRVIHQNMSAAMTVMVYGAATSVECADEIKRYNQFETIKQELDLNMSRKSGITTAVEYFMAAAMLTVPDFEGVCFVRSRLESQKIIKHVRILLNDAPLTVDNAESLGVNIHNNARLFHIYPTSASKLRGVGGNFIFIDEPVHMSTETYYEVVIPLLALTKSCIVMASIAGEPIPKWLADLRDVYGVLHRVEILAVCDECIKNRQFAECEHMLAPVWVDPLLKLQDLHVSQL